MVFHPGVARTQNSMQAWQHGDIEDRPQLLYRRQLYLDVTGPGMPRRSCENHLRECGLSQRAGFRPSSVASRSVDGSKDCYGRLSSVRCSGKVSTPMPSGLAASYLEGSHKRERKQ